MLLESQKRQIDDLPENTINKIQLTKNIMTIQINTTFNGPPGVCKQ